MADAQTDPDGSVITVCGVAFPCQIYQVNSQMAAIQSIVNMLHCDWFVLCLRLNYYWSNRRFNSFMFITSKRKDTALQRHCATKTLRYKDTALQRHCATNGIAPRLTTTESKPQSIGSAETGAIGLLSSRLLRVFLCDGMTYLHGCVTYRYVSIATISPPQSLRRFVEQTNLRCSR